MNFEGLLVSKLRFHDKCQCCWVITDYFGLLLGEKRILVQFLFDKDKSWCLKRCRMFCVNSDHLDAKYFFEYQYDVYEVFFYYILLGFWQVMAFENRILVQFLFDKDKSWFLRIFCVNSDHLVFIKIFNDMYYEFSIEPSLRIKLIIKSSLAS